MNNKTNFDSVISKLKIGRGVVCNKVDKVRMEVLATIQVAKEGSVNLFQNLAVVVVNGEYYCVNYDNKFPSGEDIVEERCSASQYISRLSSADADKIVDGVEWYRSKRCLNLNPYTVLYTYCALQGLDLIEEGYLEE